MTPLVFLDTETTGVHPGRRAWDVAMIRRDERGEVETQFFISDLDLSNADPFGLQVGRFYERHPQYAGHDGVPRRSMSAWDAAKKIEQVTRGAHLVGAVPNFDAETLGTLLRNHKLIPAWHYHLIDVEALAVGWLAAQRLPRFDMTELPWNSEVISRVCGVEPAAGDDRHTALGDARWAMRLYDRIVGPDAP